MSGRDQELVNFMHYSLVLIFKNIVNCFVFQFGLVRVNYIDYFLQLGSQNIVFPVLVLVHSLIKPSGLSEYLLLENPHNR